mgnify:CR=1 FL=1
MELYAIFAECDSREDFPAVFGREDQNRVL